MIRYLATFALLWGAIDLHADSRQIEFFEKHIRPVLANKCYECHSVKAGKQKGGLLLDSKAGLLKGGRRVRRSCRAMPMAAC